MLTPWINLGNGLAKDISFIQWYEYTGTGGGSLWILLSNLLLAHFIIRSVRGKNRNILLITWLSLILIPSAFSLWRYSVIRANNIQPSEIILIQPNMDPYTEKFTIPFRDQLNKVINLAELSATENTVWIVTPETTIDDSVDLGNLHNDQYIKIVKELTSKLPGTSVLTGMVTFNKQKTEGDTTVVSQFRNSSTDWRSDYYNSALRIDTGAEIEVYHKSKLVPGVEIQYFPKTRRLFSHILPYFGGTKWGYGSQSERVCFTHQRTGEKIAPIICYESVFGSFVTDYVKKGANALFIITNDGWWYSTEGYKQHLSYASLRAIETRRPVARCGNTGVSCFIDIRGKRVIETEWWTETVLKGSITPENRITFYVKHGDYILRISLFICILVLIYSFLIVTVMKKSNISTK
jgi:apolipoprotein N-acyltransferase